MMTPEEIEEFKEAASQDEHYLVSGIRRWLLTESQRFWLYQRDISIEDILNGRIPGGNPIEVLEMYADWNAKLGEHYFGF